MEILNFFVFTTSVLIAIVIKFVLYQDQSADPPVPESLRDRRYRMIFGNLQAIYEWHRE